MALKDSLQALGGGGSVAIVLEWVVGPGDLALVLVDFVVSNIELFMSLFAVLSGRLAPKVDWLPRGVLNKIVLALAALYAVVIASRIVRSWRNDR